MLAQNGIERKNSHGNERLWLLTDLRPPACFSGGGFARKGGLTGGARFCYNGGDEKSLRGENIYDAELAAGLAPWRGERAGLYHMVRQHDVHDGRKMPSVSVDLGGKMGL